MCNTKNSEKMYRCISKICSNLCTNSNKNFRQWKDNNNNNNKRKDIKNKNLSRLTCIAAKENYPNRISIMKSLVKCDWNFLYAYVYTTMQICLDRFYNNE